MKPMHRDEARELYKETGKNPFSFIASRDGMVRLTVMGVYENIHNADYTEVLHDSFGGTIKATTCDSLS